MTEPHSIDQESLRKLTEIVLSNLGDENFGVKNLVKKSGYSRYRLAGKLHSLTNKTVNQFIREIRLQKAFELLQKKEITAAEVAYKVGFNNVTYFNTCFHEFFGYPPGIVKKRRPEISKENIFLPVTAEHESKRLVCEHIFIFQQVF